VADDAFGESGFALGRVAFGMDRHGQSKKCNRSNSRKRKYPHLDTSLML
jgi:hypothetical protein